MSAVRPVDKPSGEIKIHLLFGLNFSALRFRLTTRGVRGVTYLLCASRFDCLVLSAEITFETMFPELTFFALLAAAKSIF
jgi:hypothetical protein